MGYQIGFEPSANRRHSSGLFASTRHRFVQSWTCPQVRISLLYARGLVRVAFKSNNTTAYVLEDLELTDKVLGKLRGEMINLDLTEPEERLPEDFLNMLVGYDYLKEPILRSLKAEALELASRFHIVHMEPYTRKGFIIVAERVLTMRESTASDIARLIATTVAQRSLDIRDVVKFRRAMQTQTEEEAHKMERLLGQPKMSVFKQCGEGQ